MKRSTASNRSSSPRRRLPAAMLTGILLIWAVAVVGDWIAFERIAGRVGPDAAADGKRVLWTAATLSGVVAFLLAVYVYRVLIREHAARDRAERTYLDLYDRSPDMQVSVDAATGTVVECNATTVDMLGFDRSEIIGKPILEFYDRGCRDRARECFESFKTTGSTRADHLQLLTSSGERIDVSLRVSAVRDENGRILRSNSVWRDIRTQIETERALVSGEARYRNLVESAPICIHEVDADGRLINMNAAGLDMIGESDPSAICGVPYLDFVLPEDQERIAGLIRRALGGEKVEYEFTSDSTPPREFRSSFVPIRDHRGRVVRLMGVTQDLTEYRASERALRQKQKIEAIGRLAGGVAHDFNNLLTVITGYCEELESSFEEGSREHRCISQVSIAADRAATLTKQLLTFSRNQERTPVVLDLNEAIGDLQTMLARLIGEDITLETRLGDDLGPIEADAGQIEQILVNLAANARDAMPEGGTLTIETRALDGGRRIGLVVTDTGQGIEAEIRERIFEPFYSTKAVGKGSGLGLATVLGIVEQNDGNIRLDSAVGRGTRVSIDFPCVARPGDTADEPAARPAHGDGGNETVLLVEDQDPVREMARLALVSRGYRVLEARDGVEALEVARDCPGIDILVTDVVMPRMGGTKLSDEMRTRFPGLKIVFVSGYVDENERRDLPADAVLVAKPYVPSELIRTIRESLDGVDQPA